VRLIILADPSWKCKTCACYIAVDSRHGYCDFYGISVAADKECCASYAPGRAVPVEG